jgi:hypothetical protein
MDSYAARLWAAKITSFKKICDVVNSEKKPIQIQDLLDFKPAGNPYRYAACSRRRSAAVLYAWVCPWLILKRARHLNCHEPHRREESVSGEAAGPRYVPLKWRRPNSNQLNRVRRAVLA